MMTVIGTCLLLSAAMNVAAQATQDNGLAIWGMMFFMIVPVLLVSRVNGWA